MQPVGNSGENLSHGWREGWTAWRGVIRPYEPILLIVMIYFLAAQALATSRNDALSLEILGYMTRLGLIVPILVGVWLIAQFIHMIVVEQPQSPLLSYRKRVSALVLEPTRWANAVPFLTVILLLSTAYSYFKAVIPSIQPFGWDVAFDRLDLALHGGTRPWEWLQPLFAYPLATTLVNAVYNTWYFAMIGVWLWLAFTLHERAARHQFLMAFVLTWIIGGSVLALLLSSAGPCYFGRIVAGSDPYLPLLQELQRINEQFSPVWALDTQNLLWQGYISGGGDISGISAMPSMHVATAALFVPMAWRMGRGAGYAAIAFFAAILIGSVHLGWHYAVDGYIGAAIAAMCWRIAGYVYGPASDALESRAEAL